MSRSGTQAYLGGARSLPELQVRLLEIVEQAQQSGDEDYALGLREAAEAIGLLRMRSDLTRQRVGRIRQRLARTLGGQ